MQICLGWWWQDNIDYWWNKRSQKYKEKTAKYGVNGWLGLGLWHPSEDNLCNENPENSKWKGVYG